MKRYSQLVKRIAFLLVAVIGASCQSPPSVSVKTDVGLHRDITVRHLGVGDLLINSPPYVIPAQFPTTVIEGCWGLAPSTWPRDHRFRITVERRKADDIAEYLRTMAGANGEYKSFGPLTAISVEGRFARRQFSWGPAVSFMSQQTQDGPYSPVNGHMAYEIWGCDIEHRQFVRVRCSITHPSWPYWGDKQVRHVKNHTRSAINADPDVAALETLDPASFYPSLTQIDRLADSISLK